LSNVLNIGIDIEEFR